ncbi:MAG: hypothetical protein ACM3O9_04135 [Methylocystaceae bacterium]
MNKAACTRAALLHIRGHSSRRFFAKYSEAKSEKREVCPPYICKEKKVISTGLCIAQEFRRFCEAARSKSEKREVRCERSEEVLLGYVPLTTRGHSLHRFCGA